MPCPIAAVTSMQSDFIFDVGLHKGVDTSFYLNKGFRVVAVEANATLAAKARQAFAEQAGTVQFFRNTANSEWGTIDPGFAERNERFGASSERIEVPARTF